jgi:hypothetical protein
MIIPEQHPTPSQTKRQIKSIKGLLSRKENPNQSCHFSFIRLYFDHNSVNEGKPKLYLFGLKNYLEIEEALAFGTVLLAMNLQEETQERERSSGYG